MYPPNAMPIRYKDLRCGPGRGQCYRAGHKNMAHRWHRMTIVVAWRD
jgi:hypothetical protein